MSPPRREPEARMPDADPEAQIVRRPDPGSEPWDPRPVVVLSRCLELEPVRYNGERISYDFVRVLEPHVRLLPVCPEVEIGLGVPREPVRLVWLRRPGGGASAPDGGSAPSAEGPSPGTEDPEIRLVQPATGRDVTGEMRRFSREFLDGLGPVDGFILKNRSPSCGMGDVKVYPSAEHGSPSERGPGLFGGAVKERFPDLAVEDEGRLRNFRIREHFLTKLFALAELRGVADSGAAAELVRFHTRHKLLLLAYDQEGMRTLGRLVANREGRPFPELVARYREGFAVALSEPPPYTAVVNVLEHAAGHFKDELGADEKRFYRSSLDRYREGRIPLSAVTAVIRSWAVRFASDWLLVQSFFEPYPEGLMSLSDSGKGGAVR